MINCRLYFRGTERLCKLPAVPREGEVIVERAGGGRPDRAFNVRRVDWLLDFTLSSDEPAAVVIIQLE